ncbi:hypothetical protein HanIR_Chr04g0162911 [Helianthus annuus]|nr:hypothetical protein HanIR_Chr04g0162911 [Helianthus annuus]
MFTESLWETVLIDVKLVMRFHYVVASSEISSSSVLSDEFNLVFNHMELLFGL